MGAALIGFVIGLVVGATTGTAMGAFGIGALGMLVGLAVYGVGWMRLHLGDAPTVERHRVMCTPFGQIADLELEGDLERGRWYDVRRCSLLRPANVVDCDKGCIRQVNAAGLRPGQPCSCQAHDEAAPIAS